MALLTISPSPPWGKLTTGIWNLSRSFSRWRPRGTKDWLLMLTTGGNGRFGRADGDLIAEPWDAVLLKPDVPHDYGLEKKKRRWDVMWAHFVPRPEWLPLLEWPTEGGPMRLRLARSQHRRAIVRRLAQAHQLTLSRLGNRQKLAMNALEEVFLRCDEAKDRTGESRVDPRITRAVEHIRRNHDQPLSLSSIAITCALSPSRLAHLFKQEIGFPPLHFLAIQRLNRARELLTSSDRPINDIAREVGFANQFYFSRRFKAMTGISPSAYRLKADTYDALANDQEVNRRRNAARNAPSTGRLPRKADHSPRK